MSRTEGLNGRGTGFALVRVPSHSKYGSELRNARWGLHGASGIWKLLNSPTRDHRLSVDRIRFPFGEEQVMQRAIRIAIGWSHASISSVPFAPRGRASTASASPVASPKCAATRTHPYLQRVTDHCLRHRSRPPDCSEPRNHGIGISF
jgi:hypothetical protein